ncbi:ATP-binding protein [Kutzneria viridogrisea]|uniref:histidine kinase n=2 Tax=Kutzneria TaxID=43356 RepID=W5W183_9PSEU|nr:ATP-binding protein [Kutzneria albida]AHH94291.1 two-component sensor kinase [Kutzneria albida DSM 43870]MBA8929955.1 signal transduction histidine kinase [Kutzneria viridogrisea]
MNPRLWWRHRALRTRIALAATVAAMVFLFLLARTASWAIGTLLINAADTELSSALDQAVPEVVAGQQLHSTPIDVQLRVLDSAGAPVDGRPAPQLDAAEIEQLKSGRSLFRENDDPPHRWLGRVVYDPRGTPRLVAAGADLVGYAHARQTGGRWLTIAGLVASVLVGGATWVVVGWSMYPVRRMREVAGALPAGQRLPVPEARDELRTLAESLNDLLARRDEANERLRRFTGDAAHELRSPVASIRAQAEVAVAHPDPEFAQEVLAAVTAESERMSTLVDDLLSLARTDAGEVRPGQRVDLAEAVASAIDRLPRGGPAVVLATPRAGVSVHAAPGEVDLVLDNLLRNAVRYARAQVRVLVLPAGTSVRLLVDDDGPGVPVEHRARVFDRFYRVDDDRGRDTGGAGLGLALVAEAVRRRGGTVRVIDSPQGGARFEARWRAAGVLSGRI